MMKFMIAYANVTGSLSRLLGMRFLPDSRDTKSAIGLALESILKYHNSGDLLARDIQLNRMALFAKHLKEIQEFDIALYRHFRKTIKRSNNIDDFFGIRFEINIASTLIRKSVPFQKSESPDFLIEYQSDKIGVECTSARLRKTKDEYDLFYKIESAIRGKSKKNYANLCTALFIDITNLVYEVSNAGVSLYNLIDRDKLSNVTNQFEFGSITLFTYLSDRQRGGIESVYTRIDHRQIDSGLTQILNICFPFGAVALQEFAVPQEG